MHISTTRRHYTGADGVERHYETHLLRRSVRVGKTVRNETLANLSHLPAELIEALRAGLAGKTLLVAGEDLELVRSRPHDHLAAVACQAEVLRLKDLLGPPCKERDIAHALVLARVVHPKPELATVTWWHDTTLVEDLGLEDVGTDEVYAAMDWLVSRQDAIETTLARRHLAPEVNPTGRAYFDLSSSWLEGRTCPLAAFGYSRDAKRNKAQIEYGLLTARDGTPVAIRVFPGNTADPAAFKDIIEVVRHRFGLTHLVMVGDRGMIASARIEALKEVGGLGWLTALRAPQIKTLAQDDGPLQLSLFDEVSFCELSHPDYPGERLVVARNPLLAAERARKRQEPPRWDRSRPRCHRRGIPQRTPSPARHRAARPPGGQGPEQVQDAGALHDRGGRRLVQLLAQRGLAPRGGCPRRRLRAAHHDHPRRARPGWGDLGPQGAQSGGVGLPPMKAIDVDLRPVHHRLEDQVEAHALMCFLATYVTFHLRRTLGPFTFTDTAPPTPTDPVVPAARSSSAKKKDAKKKNAAGEPVRAFRELLEHLGTLTRDTLRVVGVGGVTLDLVATPTPTQRQVFELLGASVPRTLM